MMKRKLKLLLVLVLGVSFAFAQTRQVTGTVKDENGEPIIGANVVVKERAGVGTVTDIDGNFSLEASAKENIEVTYIGYLAKSFLVGNITKFDVNMEVDAQTLGEVVVVGYGSQKKESVVGSIAQTTGEALTQRISGSDLSNSLTGIMPGVVTVRSSGIPGGSGEDDNATKIFIRGQSTWNGSGGPLILVDGVERDMNDIDPNQIDKISILKDASATAVFGVKGANGVILITTKRGAIGKPTLSFDVTTSANMISRVPGILGSYDANRLKNFAIVQGLPINEANWKDYQPDQVLNYYRTQEYPEIFPDVDWLDEFTNDVAWSRKAAMNVSGGTKFAKYFASLSYLYEGDILRTQNFGQGYDPNFQYNRFNFRSNLDFNLTKTTIFSVNLAGYYGQQQRPSGDKFNFWKGLTGTPPDMYPVRYADGAWGDYTGFDRFQNPVYSLNLEGLENENRLEVNSDFTLTQKLDFILPGLSFRGNLSYDNRFNTTGQNINDDGALAKYILKDVINELEPGMTEAEKQAIISKYTVYKFPDGFNNAADGYGFNEIPNTVTTENPASNVYRRLFYQLQLNYAKTFGEKHDVGFLALVNRNEAATGSTFIAYSEDWAGRATYGYDNRYFFEFNAGYNGSEKFGPGYRFGFFPSVALGWTFSNEKFFEPLRDVMNKGKVRFSSGRVGNDNGIARWLYVGGYNITGSTTSFGAPFINNGFPFRLEGTIPNPDIHWETAQKNNIGLELGFFNSNLELIADYFWEHRTDMFISNTQRNIPIIFGADPVGVNAGEVKNRGYELELKWNKQIQSKKLGYYASVNFSHVVDEVIYREDPELAPDYQKQAGYQIGQTRTTLNQGGFIQSFNELYTGVGGLDNNLLLPGNFRQVDYNADGFIDANDVVPNGYPVRPQYTYGTTFGFDWKGFSAMAQFYGVFNMSQVRSFDEFFERYSIAREWHLNNSWVPELGRTTTATHPALAYGLQGAASPKGDYWLEDRSFLRLQNAEVSYKIGKSFLNRVGVQSMRLYLNGNNIWLWSDMKEDREENGNDRAYPIMKRFTLGTNITF